ncbi:MAG: hypothetical protein ACOC40_01245 [Thermoplasmatota archaeon]
MGAIADSTSDSDSDDTGTLEVPSEESSFIDSMDPLVAYKSLEDSGEREWTDIDGDNIPDAVEQNPDIIGSSRFDDVPWIESIRKFKDEFNDTDDDERQRIFNETFNAFCKDEGEPILKKLKIEANADLELSWNDIVSGNTWGEVKIKVYDPAGIDYIRLSNDHKSKKISISSDINHEGGVVEKTIDIDTIWTDWRDGWDLKVVCADHSGNIFIKDRHVDGFIEDAVEAVNDLSNTFVNLFTGLWDTIVGGLKEAADKAVQMANTFVTWAKNKVSNMFSSVVNPIVAGLQDWANRIQTQMENFFAELAKWDEVGDGDESEDLTMEAGTAFMLSFMGQHDKAEEFTEALKWILNFIKPYKKYISTQGAIGVIAGSSNFGGYFGQVKDLVSNGISEVIGEFMSIVFGQDGYLGIAGLWDKVEEEGGISGPTFSIDALINFLDAAGLYSGLTKTLVDGAKNFLDENDMSLNGVGDTLSLVIPIVTAFISIFAAIIGGSIAALDLGLSGISIIISVITGVLNNILVSAISCIGAVWLAFLGMCFSFGEPIQLGIGLFEFFSSPLLFVAGAIA